MYISCASSYDSCTSCSGQCTSNCKWGNTDMGAPNYNAECGLYGCYTGGCYLGCTTNDCAGSCFSGCANSSHVSGKNQQTISCGGSCVSGAFCKSTVRVDPATCDGLATI